MLDNIKDLVKQYAGDSILNNPAIPNERNDEAISDASSSIVSGLKSAVANGNVDGVMDFFKSGPQAASTSPVTHNIQAGFIQNLTQKFGLDQGKATQIASSLIPIVLQKFVHKTNDPQDKSFDLNDIIGNLTGGAGIGDVMKNFGGGNNKEEGGGMMDKIKGMFN